MKSTNGIFNPNKHDPRNHEKLLQGVANVTGRDQPIPRFLAPEVAKILLDNLVVVQPFLVYFIEDLLITDRFAISQIHGIENGRTYNLFLCVRNGKRMESSQLRCLFKSVMLQYFDMDLCFQGYRHVTQAFSEKHLTTWVPELPLELQAGYSVETGRQMYARSTQDFPNATRDDIITFRKMSIQ